MKNLKFFMALNSPGWRWALIIALLSDAIGFLVVLMPPVQWVVDAITAMVLLMVLGFRWSIFLALAIELIPAIQLFPAWSLWVLTIGSTDNQKSGKQRI
jgi:hypothetical protein